jgi:putative PIN family toxin of toxin-antitoxin system
MRVVLDANIYVGAELSPFGVCLKVIKFFTALNSPFELILTSKIVMEVSEVLMRPRIMKITTKDEPSIRLLVERLENFAVFVPDMPIPVNSCRDPKDLIYLAAADTAKADLIVSLDKDLLDLTEFRGIKIIKPHEFIFIANQVSF